MWILIRSASLIRENEREEKDRWEERNRERVKRR